MALPRQKAPPWKYTSAGNGPFGASRSVTYLARPISGEGDTLCP